MPSFKSMEISKELSNDNRLSIKNSLFGILSKVTYQPTHSKIVSKKIEYTQAVSYTHLTLPTNREV